MLFEEVERVDDDKKRAGESTFAFLDRCSWPEIQAVRELLNELVSEYPDEERNEMLARLRSGDDTQFSSASFELILYVVLVRCGCEVEVHPELENGSPKRPDFLVTPPGEDPFYLECACVSERGYADAAVQSRRDHLYEVLNKSPHDNFALLVMEEEGPSGQPSAKDLVADLHGWLDQLDVDEVLAAYEETGGDALPEHGYEAKGYRVRFVAYPKKVNSRGEPSDLIVSYLGQGGWVNRWMPARDKIMGKGGAYGDLDKPLLIAINYNVFSADEQDDLQALYGQLAVVFSIGESAKSARQTRKRNGAWTGRSGPRYTRIGGVWFFSDLNAYRIGDCRNCLYLNPWAARPLPEFVKQFPTVEPEGDNLVPHEGIHISALIAKHGKDEG